MQPYPEHALFCACALTATALLPLPTFRIDLTENQESVTDGFGFINHVEVKLVV